MQENDVTFVMYKIINYLYGCEKDGVQPFFEHIRFDSPHINIPKEYWVDIMTYLNDRYYVKGLVKIPGEVFGNEQLSATVPGMLWCDGMRDKIEAAKKELGYELQTNA